MSPRSSSSASRSQSSLDVNTDVAHSLHNARGDVVLHKAEHDASQEPAQYKHVFCNISNRHLVASRSVLLPSSNRAKRDGMAKISSVCVAKDSTVRNRFPEPVFTPTSSTALLVTSMTPILSHRPSSYKTSKRINVHTRGFVPTPNAQTPQKEVLNMIMA